MSTEETKQNQTLDKNFEADQKKVTSGQDYTRDFQDRVELVSIKNEHFSVLETSIPQYARQLTTWPDCYWDFTIGDSWHLASKGFTDEAWETGGFYYSPYNKIEARTLSDIISRDNIKLAIGFGGTNDSPIIKKNILISGNQYWTPVGVLQEHAIRQQKRVGMAQMVAKPFEDQLRDQVPSFDSALKTLCEKYLEAGNTSRYVVTHIEFPNWIFNRYSKAEEDGVTAWFNRPDSEVSAWAQYVTIYYIKDPFEITGEELRHRIKELDMPFIQIDLDEHAMGFRFPKQARPEGVVTMKFLESHDWIIHDLLVYWKSLLFESGSRTFGSIMSAGMYGLLRIYVPYWGKDIANPDGSKGATKYFVKRIYYWNLMCVDISNMSLEYESGEGHTVEAEFSVEWITSSNTRLKMQTEKYGQGGYIKADKSLADLQALTEQIKKAKGGYSDSEDAWDEQNPVDSMEVENHDSNTVLNKETLG